MNILSDNSKKHFISKVQYISFPPKDWDTLTDPRRSLERSLGSDKLSLELSPLNLPHDPSAQRLVLRLVLPLLSLVPPTNDDKGRESNHPLIPHISVQLQVGLVTRLRSWIQ